MIKIPKTLTNHPAMGMVCSGASQSSDYKYWVELKHGWCWARGRNAGGRSLGLMSVADFRHAEPVPATIELLTRNGYQDYEIQHMLPKVMK